MTIRLIRMAAVITPDSFAVTAEYCSMACNGRTGFFAQVFITDIVSFPGDYSNACHKNALPGVTLRDIYKNTFFFIQTGNLA